MTVPPLKGLGRLLAQPWLIAFVVAGIAPVLYYGVRMQLGELGYDMFPMWVSLPNTFDLLWPVAPGAAMAAVLLDYTLGPFRAGTLIRRLSAGVVLGGVLGWANAPLTVLMALYLHSADPASGISFWTACKVWVVSVPAILTLSFPVAVPCGALLGFLVATMGALGGELSNSTVPD